MARGSDTDIKTIYKVLALYCVIGSYAEVARQLNMPPSTVEKLVKDNKDKPEFVELCVEKKKTLSNDFNEIIDLAVKRIKQELIEEEKIPLNHLSTVIGTIYDKNRLEQGESTENTNQTITIGFSDEIQELSK
jgi:nucleoid DNA-binding protein